LYLITVGKKVFKVAVQNWYELAAPTNIYNQDSKIRCLRTGILKGVFTLFNRTANHRLLKFQILLIEVLFGYRDTNHMLDSNWCSPAVSIHWGTYGRWPVNGCVIISSVCFYWQWSGHSPVTLPDTGMRSSSWYGNKWTAPRLKAGRVFSGMPRQKIRFESSLLLFFLWKHHFDVFAFVKKAPA
jgi:hypothetical protein